jgi:MIP family channel proteins
MAAQLETMEVTMTDIKASLAEGIATALFVFMGVGSVFAMLATAPDLGGGIVIVAGAFGLSISLLAAGIGPISGGHINPAITFAMLITGRISIPKGVMYIIAQLLGAAIGMLLLKAFLSAEAFDVIPPAGGNNVSQAVANNLAAVGVEALITFFLVWTVFATAVSPKGNTIIAPLVIGFAVFVIHLVAIPLTGTGANPARTFGPALVQGDWDDHWVYWVGPLLGAALAGLSYWTLYLSDDEATA